MAFTLEEVSERGMKMASFEIFGLQFLLSVIGYGLIARWYVAPRLAALPLHAALVPLLFPHAFRHLGLVFLVPAVVAPTLPPAFALPAAYGDLLAGVLALAAIVALRNRWPLAIPLTWLFNLVGTLDLLYAFYQGISRGVGPHLGSAWYVPTFLVPALYVTHFMIFVTLIRRSR
ncbi:MAG TPA: hypothetical protein VJA45_07835 [Methylomirabilota bacterium]|jgi:hypothetical protein|nr:hypothetical protein [Methylomirabilota bacterium]